MRLSDGDTLRPDHPGPRPLLRLVQEFDLEYLGDLDDVEATGVAVLGGPIRPGDVYVSVAEEASSLRAELEAAHDAGAVAALAAPAVADALDRSALPVILVAEPRTAVGPMAAWVHRTDEEPVPVFAVAGTEEATVTAHVLAALLDLLGLEPGVSTAVERRVGDTAVPGDGTDPHVIEIHAMLALLHERGGRAAVLDVGARALAEGRLDGIDCAVIGVTGPVDGADDELALLDEALNLFHPDRAAAGIVAIDSEWGRRLAEGAHIPVRTVAVGGDVDADWRLEILELSARGSHLRLLDRDGGVLETWQPLLGRDAALAAAIAIAMVVESGTELAAVDALLHDAGRIPVVVPGRVEVVSGDEGPLCIVDDSRAPAPISAALAAARAAVPGRVIAVAGLRDGVSDAERGEIARALAAGADQVIVSDDHPGDADPARLRAALRRALETHGATEVTEADGPSQAIRTALDDAEPGDVVVWLGPGRERTMNVAGGPVAYAAIDDAREALKEAGWL